MMMRAMMTAPLVRTRRRRKGELDIGPVVQSVDGVVVQVVIRLPDRVDVVVQLIIQERYRPRHVAVVHLPQTSLLFSSLFSLFPSFRLCVCCNRIRQNNKTEEGAKTRTRRRTMDGCDSVGGWMGGWGQYNNTIPYMSPYMVYSIHTCHVVRAAHRASRITTGGYGQDSYQKF